SLFRPFKMSFLPQGVRSEEVIYARPKALSIMCWSPAPCRGALPVVFGKLFVSQARARTFVQHARRRKKAGTSTPWLRANSHTLTMEAGDSIAGDGCDQTPLAFLADMAMMLTVALAGNDSAIGGLSAEVTQRSPPSSLAGSLRP
ncbi:MAG TPA: hypothetical protein VL147_14260, partial [Devosia sp.]|nr:hypothetical protein [Devosia sp.]